MFVPLFSGFFDGNRQGNAVNIKNIIDNEESLVILQSMYTVVIRAHGGCLDIKKGRRT